MSTVLLLGAYSDIGQALARQYADRGFTVWLAGRGVQRLQPLVSDLEIRYEAQTAAYEFNALDYASHQRFLDDLPALPDIAICIFGLLGDQTTAQSNWEEAHRIIDTNYTGAVSIFNLLADRMSARQSGTLVGISSVAGERGRQSNYLYGSAKGAFSLYLQGLRNRLSAHHVHVMTVKPGFVNTKMTEHLTLPKPVTAMPDQVAAAVRKGVEKGKNTVYVLWIWRYIMLIIRTIPEFMFKKMKL